MSAQTNKEMSSRQIVPNIFRRGDPAAARAPCVELSGRGLSGRFFPEPTASESLRGGFECCRVARVGERSSSSPGATIQRIKERPISG
jgi:hypothetical protein